MRELFEKIVKDEGLQALLAKSVVKKAEDHQIILLEQRTTKWGSAVQLINYYSNWEDYEANFTDALRAGCSNRLVVYNGTGEYEFLTDIVDNSDEGKKGHWAVMGYGAETPDPKQRAFIMKEFESPAELNAEKNKYLEQIDQLAIMHQYGTTDYTMIMTKTLSTIKPEHITEGAKNVSDEIKKSTDRWKKKMKDVNGPISDGGPAINV